MSESTNCPDERTLREFVAGRLDTSVADRLHVHLSACPPCAQKLAALQRNQQARTEAGTTAASSAPQQTKHFDEELSDSMEFDESRFDFKLLAASNHHDAVGRLGKYDILSIEGYGGMGVVFKAYDEQLRRSVAIKVLNRALASSATARRRFIREARAAAAINHPNVVTIHAVEEHDSLPFIVMEFVNGRSLRDRIRKEQKLEPIEALRLSLQIAAGLAAAHAQGVIHRDIKPGNIMLEQGMERVKITDFGLARAAIDNVELTSRELAVGTPAYMAPEQVSSSPVDLRADLFSLGCVMFAMLAGQSPFQGTNALEMARKVADYTPTPLHELDPHIPPFLSDIVARLLEKSPDARYQSASEVGELLNRHLTLINQCPSDQLTNLLQTAAPKPAETKPKTRAAWSWAAVAGAAVLTAVATRPFWLPNNSQEPQALREPGQVSVEESPFASPESPEYLATIGVSKKTEAQFSSIGEALARAGRNTTIEVLDDSTYEETLRIANDQQLRGVKLVAKHGATLRAPGAGDASGTRVIDIRDVSEVVVSGFKIETPVAGHAIYIGGSASAITIEGVTCTQAPNGRFACIQIFVSGKAGRDQPICIRDSTIDSSGTGQCVWIHGHPDPCGSIQLTGNRFIGAGTQVALWGEATGTFREVVLAGNIFQNGTSGINLTFEHTLADTRIQVTNNSFLGTEFWIGITPALVNRPIATICNNLILGSRQIQADGLELSTALQYWTFRSNWWERGSLTEMNADLTGRLAEMHQSIPLLSRDPRDPNFLVPPQGSPLWTAGCGVDLPGHVGARGPAEVK